MEKKFSMLGHFQEILPPFESTQENSIKRSAEVHARAQLLSEKKLYPSDEAHLVARFEKFFQRFGVKPHQISKRYFETSDSLNNNWAEKEIYLLNEESPSGVDTFARNKFFHEKSSRVFAEMYQNSAMAPDHILHVTCTGYASPSAAQMLVASKMAQKNWKRAPQITHAYHMGCYASLPALRLAQALVDSNQDHTVDIVHNEICSIHLSPLDHSPEQMVVQSLFADGHIKYALSNRPASQPHIGYRIIAIQEQILENSEKDMTWIPGSHGMRMTLSREVPEKITAHAKNFFHKICADAGWDPRSVLDSGLFAIHPGGPLIIHSIQDAFQLREEQVVHSKKVLHERGNMSSATLPHVWNSILKHQPSAGTKIVSLAFGPGLTIFGALFEVHSA